MGLDGSGGWGWNNATNAPVTALVVGKQAALTVTVLQSDSTPLCNSGDTLTVILTYSSQDFKLKATDSRGVTGSPITFQRGGVETFSYTGDFLCHTAQSTAYTFTPKNATATALVTATVSVYSPGSQSVVEQASETFPVQIVVPSSQQ